MDEHWLDELNKLLIQETRRRGLMRVAAISITSCALGVVAGADAARKRNTRKGKGNGKGKGKGKRKGKTMPPLNPPPICSGGVCAAVPQWVGNEDQISHCEFICAQCAGSNPPRFCIIGGSVADCCDEGLACCGDICVNIWEDDNHCAGCNQRCSPGKVCFGGDCVCQVGLILCGDTCRDTNRDPNHCGGCDAPPCRGPGMQCCNGHCVDTRTDAHHCGGCNRIPCSGPGMQCCDGSCVDTRWSELHCGGCGASCQSAQLCCHGNGRGCIDSCGGFCIC